MEYTVYKAKYEERHQSSIPVLELEEGLYPAWLEKVVILMFIAGSLLSGVHTVPAVREGMTTAFWPQWVIDAVSIASYVAVELVFFVGAYALIRKRQWHVIFTLLAAFIVAMVSNIDQNIRAYAAATQTGNIGQIIVAGVLGVGAPFIAFMAGKMLVDIYRARRAQITEARRKLKIEQGAWEQHIEALYLVAEAEEKRIYAEAEDKRLKAEQRTERERSRQENEISRNSMKKPVKGNRRVNLHEVARQIHENGDTEARAADWMEKYNISMGSTTKIRELLKARGEKTFTNGHGTDVKQ